MFLRSHFLLGTIVLHLVIFLARGEELDILESGIEDALDGFLAVKTDVGSEDDVVSREQILILMSLLISGLAVDMEALILFFDRFLTLEDIEAGSGENTMIECFDEGFILYDATSGGIDEERPRFDFFDTFTIDEVVRLFIVWHMESDDIGMGEDRFEWHVLKVEHFRQEGVLPSI